QLNVIDDEEQTVTREPFYVTIDAPPEPQITGPEVVGLGDFPMELDGSSSLDPDSACPTNLASCYDTAPGFAISNVTNAIVDHQWSMEDLTPERHRHSLTGPV